jgi:hypothetical protein
MGWQPARRCFERTQGRHGESAGSGRTLEAPLEATAAAATCLVAFRRVPSPVTRGAIRGAPPVRVGPCGSRWLRARRFDANCLHGRVNVARCRLDRQNLPEAVPRLVGRPGRWVKERLAHLQWPALRRRSIRRSGRRRRPRQQPRLPRTPAASPTESQLRRPLTASHLGASPPGCKRGLPDTFAPGPRGLARHQELPAASQHDWRRRPRHSEDRSERQQ